MCMWSQESTFHLILTLMFNSCCAHDYSGIVASDAIARAVQYVRDKGIPVRYIHSLLFVMSWRVSLYRSSHQCLLLQLLEDTTLQWMPIRCVGSLCTFRRFLSDLSVQIIAQPSTITGSIGVFTIKLSVKGLLDKVGITTDTIGNSDNNDSLIHPWNSVEREKATKFVTEVYDRFVTNVAKVGRPSCCSFT